GGHRGPRRPPGRAASDGDRQGGQCSEEADGLEHDATLPTHPTRGASYGYSIHGEVAGRAKPTIVRTDAIFGPGKCRDSPDYRWLPTDAAGRRGWSTCGRSPGLRPRPC